MVETHLATTVVPEEWFQDLDSLDAIFIPVMSGTSGLSVRDESWQREGGKIGRENGLDRLYVRYTSAIPTHLSEGRLDFRIDEDGCLVVRRSKRGTNDEA